MNSSNGVGAFNARVRVNDPEHLARSARRHRVVDCDTAVEHIEQKLAGFRHHLDGQTEVTEADTIKLAALHTALEAAKAEATQARAEAQERN